MYAAVALLCLAALVSGQQLVDPNAQQQQQQGANVQAQAQQGQQQQQQLGGQARSFAQVGAAGAYVQPGGQVVVSVGQPRPVQVVQTVQYGQGQQGQAQYQQGQGQQAQAQQTAVDASRAQIAAAIAQGANPNNFAIQTNARYQIAQAPNPQNPDVFTALDALRGRQDLTIDEILNILSSAVAGRDYPIYNDIPSTRFSCENVKQAGFYADAEAQCQVIRRCDINGVLWSYLCPNMTLFNQITLVCDWFFNVNCQNSVQYYDYSNPRLYTQFALLDTPAGNYGQQRPIGAQPTYQAPRNNLRLATK